MARLSHVTPILKTNRQQGSSTQVLLLDVSLMKCCVRYVETFAHMRDAWMAIAPNQGRYKDLVTETVNYTKVFNGETPKIALILDQRNIRHSLKLFIKDAMHIRLQGEALSLGNLAFMDVQQRLQFVCGCLEKVSAQLEDSFPFAPLLLRPA